MAATRTATLAAPGLTLPELFLAALNYKDCDPQNIPVNEIIVDEIVRQVLAGTDPLLFARACKTATRKPPELRKLAARLRRLAREIADPELREQTVRAAYRRDPYVF